MPLRKFVTAMMLVVPVALQGCAGAGLTVFGAGAGTAAGTGVNHTLSGVAYKTFTLPSEDVRNAALETLVKMEMKITGDKKAEAMREITATATNREITIEIEPLTPRTTRMRVIVTEGALFKDAATATEIIAQTIDRLEEPA